MKQKQNHNYLWIASLLAITLCAMVSCTKEIKFNGEQIDPKIVLNGLIEPSKTVCVNASKSVFFLDNEANTEAPDDLVATLYVNGTRIGEMTPHKDTIYYFDGWDYYDAIPGKAITVFTHDYCPVAGDVIKITASANGFDEVEATTSPLPNEVSWRIASCQPTLWEVSFEEYEGDTVWTIMGRYEISVEITDPNPGQTDYFRIHVEGDSYYDYETGNYIAYNAIYDDPIFGVNVSNSDFIDIDFQERPEGVFTDALFDGRSYQIKLPLSVYISYRNEFPIYTLQVPISLEHLSREYYYYLNTCQQVSEIMQFFTEPIQTYTNVEGGFGIVGGRTADSLLFELPLSRR